MRGPLQPGETCYHGALSTYPGTAASPALVACLVCGAAATFPAPTIKPMLDSGVTHATVVVDATSEREETRDGRDRQQHPRGP
jgi:hypothetical protein